MQRALAKASLTAMILLAAGCGGNESAAPTTGGGATTVTAPDCSRVTILAAVKDGASGQDVRELSEYKCSGDWAYAGVVTSGPDGIEFTAVLRRAGEGWKAVDRAKPCEDHEVPSDIYQAACESN